MPTPLPREPSGSSTLHETVKKLIRCIKERTLLGSTDYGLEHHADGVFLRFKQDPVKSGGGQTAFRGIWLVDTQYKEGDIVCVRGAPIEGAGHETSGTFWCVRDHLSTATNYPKELLPEQFDPVSSGPTDLWRTFAVGAWPQFTVRAFPIPVTGGPPIILPAYTLIDPGRVGTFGGTGSGGGFAGIDQANGSASGLKTGSGRWELIATDLPVGKVAKWRLLTLCIGNEKYTAYFAMTAPELVP